SDASGISFVSTLISWFINLEKTNKPTMNTAARIKTCLKILFIRCILSLFHQKSQRRIHMQFLHHPTQPRYLSLFSASHSTEQNIFRRMLHINKLQYLHPVP